MIIILTQNYGLINISNFNNIAYERDGEEHLIVLDGKYILGKYSFKDIPTIISWLGNTIAQHKVDENLCISMPSADFSEPIEEDNVDAEND